MRIELVGGMGAGKSTLCAALAGVGCHAVYESLVDNPFLADCFADPAAFRFPSQMWFAVSKLHEIATSVAPGRLTVHDQAVLTVRAYTDLLFGDEDPEGRTLIDGCFAYLERRCGPPDLLVALTCRPETQRARIARRGRAHERAVTLSQIGALQREIDRLLDAARDAGTPVLTLDTENAAPGDRRHAETVLAAIVAALDGSFDGKNST